MKNILTSLIFCICITFSLKSQTNNIYKFIDKLLDGEGWWGGVVVDGPLMPIGKFEYQHDLYGNIKENQGSPVLISSEGRYVWCDQPFSFEFFNDSLKIYSPLAEINAGKSGNTLRDAYLYVSQNFFPPQGKIPDELLFTKPQYNTWIELTYNQNENDILKYAQSIVDNDFPPGVIMIDDNWQEDYGHWDFKAEKFDNPKEMVKKLHELGFKVMLWVCPFVSPDSPNYRYLETHNAFLIEDNENKKTCNNKVVEWCKCFTRLYKSLCCEVVY